MAKPQVQYAALPYRRVGGELQVLLVTSRETRRWILPKGRPEKKYKGFQVAELEAFEEAGVRGNVTAAPVGTFPSFKRLADGTEVATVVKVYALDVTEECDSWPEQHQRQRQWLALAQAAALAGEPALATFLTQYGLDHPA